MYETVKNGIAVSIRLCHFTSESSRKESDCEGDYIDFVSFQESQILPWISKAEELVGHISVLVQEQIS